MSTSALPNTESRGGVVKALTLIVYIAFFFAARVVVQGTIVCGADGVCLESAPPTKLWIIIPIFPALAVWFGGRRLLDGPSVHRDDLVVFFSLPGGGAGPRLADLLASLASAGYTPRAFRIDDGLQPTAPATGNEPLLGTKFLIQETRSRARLAFARLALSSGPKGTGIIEVSDTDRGLYAELATYMVRGLTPLLSDLQFRRLNSALPPEAGRDLILPPRPAQLQ